MDREEALSFIFAIIREEFDFASAKFGQFNSCHEGYAVIAEELDELWDEVKNNGDLPAHFQEAKQVAAMAVRYIFDLCMDHNSG